MFLSIIMVIIFFSYSAAETLDSEFIPDEASFEMSVDVTFKSDYADFTLCCYDFEYE